MTSSRSPKSVSLASLLLTTTALCCLLLLNGQVSAQNQALPLTQQEKTQIVQAHNTCRNNVNPPAQNMVDLVWDDQLANIAQNYVNQCIGTVLVNHNSNRGVGYPTSVGENIYASTGQITNMANVVNSWDSEKKDYNYDTNSCKSGAVCGHYTQVV